MGGFMIYTVEMGSNTMTFISRFTKICSGIQKLKGQTHADIQIHTQEVDLVLFCKNKESRLKRTAVLTAVELLFAGKVIYEPSANEVPVCAEKRRHCK
jgi:hypothetical protein